MLSPVSAWPHRDALPALDMTPWSAFGIVFDCSGREGFSAIYALWQYFSMFISGMSIYALWPFTLPSAWKGRFQGLRLCVHLLRR